MSPSDRPQLDLKTLRGRLALAVVACVALGGLGYWLDAEQFFRSYLFAFLFWIGISLGCLILVMVHHLVGGGWGIIIRRILEAGFGPLPLMAVLFVPVLFGMEELYEWSRPEAVAQDKLLAHKAPYLNDQAFMARAAVYLAAWCGLGLLLFRWSRAQDEGRVEPIASRLMRLSAAGLVLAGLTITFASIDWMMSLEPHWYSAAYGVIVILGQSLAGLAFAIVALWLLSRQNAYGNLPLPDYCQDLGNLLFAALCLWVYVSFSQYLIIWSGNLPEDAFWYARRSRGGWGWVALALILLHFVAPFLVLLTRDVKRNLFPLAAVAGLLLSMHLLDLFWRIKPAFHGEGLSVHWLDVVTLLGVGGAWLLVFLWRLERLPLLPTHASEVLQHD